MGSPEWTGDEISVLSLHRPRSVMARLDVLPFVVLYTALVAYVVRIQPAQFVAGFAATVLVVLHLLAFLVQHWSLRARVWMGYWRVRAIGERDEEQIRSGKIRVKVEPPPHKGRAELNALECDGKRIHFSFQKRMYEYNRESGKFEMVLYPEHYRLREYAEAARKFGGLNDDAAVNQMIRFGINRLEIPLPKFWDLYREQLLSPFFVFQVFCILLWVLEAYWHYFAMTLGMMLIFEATVVKGRLRSLTELRGMRNRPTRVNVYRNRKWVTITSLELLPGDIISLTRGSVADAVAPCDCLIISGGAVVNEAMLTGESVPLMKEGITPLAAQDGEEELNIKYKDKAHVIFGGTRILNHTPATVSDATPPSKTPDNGCVCYVLRTGFGSSQGILLKTILTSTEKVSANSWEAAMFILFLLVFALLAAAFVLIKGLELPMQLALAVNASLVALSQQAVFCTEPFRIPFAGKVDVCCFDKTGTITTDDIKAVGVALPVDEAEATGEAAQAKLVLNKNEYPLLPTAEASLDAACVLAACHSLVYVDNELAGDPLELAAIESVGWSFTRSDAAVPRKGNGNGVKILQRHRFISKLQRMSTIVQAQSSGVPVPPRALVKGSAEAVGELLTEKPAKYDATALGLARRGMRVLALAHKEMDGTLTPSALKSMTREEVEQGLTFVGFVAFECPLRPDSKKTVKNLRGSSHRVVMITGDAVLTAAHVAKEVGICSKRMPTYILRLSGDQLEWTVASTGKRKAAFNAKEDMDPSAFHALLPLVRIFARMSPDQKERVLTGYKDQGLLTLMCGDGTNDVGALKQAHVGVALLSTTPSHRPPPGASAATLLRTQKRGEVSVPSAVAAANRAKSGAAGVNKTKGVKKASSSSTATGEARKEDRVNGNGSCSPAGKTSAVKDAAAATANDWTMLTPEQRRQREAKEKLEKQVKDLEALMADDEPKLVKLGDASIASPFTSKKMSIDSCAVIIRQGRCTLATTLQMYQILALNCLISAYGLSVLYLDGVKYGDKQMTLSGIVIAMAFFFITRANPLDKLSPQRPASSVFHPSLFISLIAQFAVHLFCLAFMSQLTKTYLPADFDPDIDGEFEPNVLNTIIFLLSTSQQVVVFAVNYKGFPFMQGLKDNKVLRNTLLFNFVLVLVLALELMPELNEFAQLAPMPEASLRYAICKWILLDAVASYVVDRLSSFVFRPPIRDT